MSFFKIFIKPLRKLYRIKHGEHIWQSDENVQFFNQEANDFIFAQLNKAYEKKRGYMIAKFGTIELNSIVTEVVHKNRSQYLKEYIRNEISIYPEDTIKGLCTNAGFFPKDLKLQRKYAELCLNDMKYVDILASYIDIEKYVLSYLNCKFVNLNGFYAPYLWENPWTSFLKDKKVLVIHPFKESILKQYNQRERLFDDSMVLPTFKSLQVIKAVQSIGGVSPNKEQLPTWFDALSSMEKEIDCCDFDIAIIGCGAYGFNLAAYIKRKGKIAIHMAGWTQMLFGIYGNRWMLSDQSEFKKYINEFWIRPSNEEKPQEADTIENGCYW